MFSISPDQAEFSSASAFSDESDDEMDYFKDADDEDLALR